MQGAHRRKLREKIVRHVEVLEQDKLDHVHGQLGDIVVAEVQLEHELQCENLRFNCVMSEVWGVYDLNLNTHTHTHTHAHTRARAHTHTQQT